MRVVLEEKVKKMYQGRIYRPVVPIRKSYKI